MFGFYVNVLATYLHLNSFSQVKDKLPRHKLLIFTGPIDAYYEAVGMPKLEYRGQCYKTFYGSDLRIFVISYSVCP
jgi:hypothetical protein